MVNGACLNGYGENGQSIASGGSFFGYTGAIRPEYYSDCRSATHPDRIAINRVRVFTIDIDNTIWAVDWRGIGCPTATIIRSQPRSGRSIKLTEHDGECRNRRARNSLCAAAAARHYNYCQHYK